MMFVMETDEVHVDGDGIDSLCTEMDIEENDSATSKNRFQGFATENGEGGSNVVFSRESPLINKELRPSRGSCSVKKLKARVTMATTDSELAKKEKVAHKKKLSRQDRVELGRLFQGAVSSHDWELAESLLFLADPQTLNDVLCITLDLIWFLSTPQELLGVTGLIKNIIANGAYDFTVATLRTSFLASLCVSVPKPNNESCRHNDCNGPKIHVSAYGVHWNFFFTLAALLFLISIFNIPPQYSAILIGYQTSLNHGLNMVLLSTQRGTDIISQSKEGIFSILGNDS